jgi:hypothetical protein
MARQSAGSINCITVIDKCCNGKVYVMYTAIIKVSMAVIRELKKLQLL